jgi:hypothetical protein
MRAFKNGEADRLEREAITIAIHNTAASRRPNAAVAAATLPRYNSI